MRTEKIFSETNNWRRAVSQTALLLLYNAAAYIIVLAILSAATGGEFWKQFTEGSKTQEMTIAYCILLYAGVISATILFRKNSKREKGIKDAFFSGDSKKSSIEGLISGSGMFFLFFAVIYPISYSEPSGQPAAAAIHALINLPACFLLALSEEFIFRGIFFEIFSMYLKKYEAVISASAIFALAHMFCHGTILYKSVYFLNLFLMSVIFCIGNAKFRNIWFSSAMHFIFVYLILMRNYLSLWLLKPEAKGIMAGFDNSPVTGLTAAFIMIIVIIAIHKKNEFKKI